MSAAQRRSDRANVVLAAVVVAALAGPAGCRRADPPATPTPPPRARHLVLVTIDTLRADRLGLYGARDVETPALDRIGRAGAWAPDTSAHVALTRPSHASLLTGRLPAGHGLRDNVTPPLAEDVPTLAELLRPAGFRSAAFVSAVVLSAQAGLGRGFDAYADRFEVGADDARFLNAIQKRGDETLAEALAWLEAQQARAAPANTPTRLFLWLHLYDPHDPYDPPEPYATRYAGRLYDGEVAWSDELVGRLDAALDRWGLRPETLLVVTSDHGEGLGQHGENVHGFFAYESTLRVPLLVRGPGVAPGTQLDGLVRHVDVLPSVLDLLGVEVAPAARTRFDGRSLAATLAGGRFPRAEPLYAEALLPLLHYGWSDLRVLRQGRYKYIQAPRPELYDLQTDPHEERDLSRREPARAEALRAALARHLEVERQTARSAPAGSAAAPTVPAELLERLGALGYVGAGTGVPGATTGADPKDKIEDFKELNRLMREGLLALRERQFAVAARHLQALQARGVSSFEAHYYLGRALSGLRRFREAERQYERAAERLPGFGPAHLGAAESLLARGAMPAALERLQRGRAAAPKDARLAQRLAQLAHRLGRREEAVQAGADAVALAPRDALLRVQLGELLRDLGRLDEARTQLRAALEIEPSTASYWNSLGLVLGAQNDFAAAEAAFREASTRVPHEAHYAFNLGLALLRQGRHSEAAASFARALELRPDFADARRHLALARRR